MDRLEQSGRIQNIAAWAIVSVTAFVDAIWISLSDFRFDISGSSNALITVVAVGALFWLYRTYRCDERIVATLSGVLLLISFTAATALLSYLSASLNQPFWDDALHQWDKALGLDWRAYLTWVNERPFLGVLLTIAYESLLIQMILACVALGFTGRIFQLHCFTLAVVISGVVCVLISAVMPAMAMYVYLGLQPTDFPNLSPVAAYVHVEHMLGIRDGSLRVLNLNNAEGIITFPSYHAALGVIFLAAFWPVPALGWLAVALNCTLIAATPIHGGHYFIDVGAGIIIAVMSLGVVRTLSKLFIKAKVAVTMVAGRCWQSAKVTMRRLLSMAASRSSA